MATNPDKDDFLEDDEQDELARRSIFSAGWFRALLVLTVLAIIVVVSLPYLLNWLEPTSAPPARTQAKSSEPARAAAPAPPVPAPAPSAPTLIPAPAAPASPAKAEAPAPTPPAAKPEVTKPAPAPAAPSPPDRPLGKAPQTVAPTPPAPAAKSEPAAKPAPTAQPTAPAKSEPAARPAPTAQPATPAKTAPAEATKAAPEPKRSPAAVSSQGNYWVQVGAFLEARNAEALAKQLRGENFPVQVSSVTRGGGTPAPAKSTGGQNELFITGSTPDAVNAALKGKGSAQAVKGGVAVNPPFDLETAMSLSTSLKKDGFKVVIRRATASPAKSGGGGATYHLVRVGGYADRAKAQQARGELEGKGHPGFLTQGAAR